MTKPRRNHTIIQPQRRVKPKPTPAPEYAPGHFTALMRQHNWPPGFQPQPRDGHKPATPSAGIRTPGGFDALPLGLPGARPHTQRWREEAAAKA